MQNLDENTEFGNILKSWDVPEFESHKRSKGWYITAIIAAFLMLIFALFTANFLFAVIIIISAYIIILHDNRTPDMVKFSITDEGVIIGRRFHDYDEIKNFSILFKPTQKLSNIYFEFNSQIKQRLSVPMINENPLQIREILLKYLSEDLERVNEPLSEQLSRLLKL